MVARDDYGRGMTVPIREIDFAEAQPTVALEGLQQDWCDVLVAHEQAVFGDKGSPWTLAELRQQAVDPDFHKVSLGWLDGDRVVGSAAITLPVRDNLANAYLDLVVHPDHRGRGIGQAPLGRLEQVAAAHGRSTMMVESQWRVGEDPSASFASRNGYAAAQIVVRSELALPGSLPLWDVAGGYEVLSMLDELPEGWLADLAVLIARMSTDTPLGDLALEPEVWDAERVRTENRQRLASGRRVVESVVRHLDSGALVAFTELAVSEGSPQLAYQLSTLVLPEHRGHGLGLAVKLANVAALQRFLPEVTSVRTWNADDNRHMLAVNDALGFVPDGFLSEWQKKAGGAGQG